MNMFRLLIAVLLLVSPGFTQQLGYDDYVDQLAEKIRFKDEKGFDRIIKSNVPHVFADVRNLSRKPDDAESQAALQRFKDSWQRVFETDTIDRMVHGSSRPRRTASPVGV